IIIIISSSLGLIGIYSIVNKNEENYIVEDINNVADFSKNYIYTEKVLREVKNPFNLANTINNLFDVYVFINLENEVASSGKLLSNKHIESFKSENDKTKSKLNLYKKYNSMVGTLYYPIYIDSEYYGDLILQKDYSKIHMLNTTIIVGVAIVLILIAIILIFLIYFIIRKTIKPLEELTKAMVAFGNYEKIESLKAETNDEIGELTIEFNNMKDNILTLQDTSTEFFNNVTHELKTPLTVIRGYTQLLEDEFEDEDLVSMLKSIENETGKMNDLIQNILTLSKAEMPLNIEKEEINIKYLIEDILNLFNGVIKLNNYKINLDLEDINIVSIKEDVRTIVSNLIDNAIKYSEDNVINIKLSSKSLVICNKCGVINEDIKDRL
ncbi:MAG: HAMP domain-containing sensor histidine kinase, partial [Clostridium baratii]|nr:HAMP domain-containing sensor histidine kinase [Clostridium baratii]